MTGSAVAQIRPKSEPNTATVIEPQREEGRKAVGDVLREGSRTAHGVELVRRSASRTVLAPTTQPRARSSLNGVGALAPSPGRPSCPGSDQDAHRALMERYFGSNLTRHACQSGRIKSREASADMCSTGAPGPLSGSPLQAPRFRICSREGTRERGGNGVSRRFVSDGKLQLERGPSPMVPTLCFPVSHSPGHFPCRR